MDTPSATLGVFDIIILVPFIYAFWRGFMNGFLVEAMSLFVLLLLTYGYLRIASLPSNANEISRTLEYLPLSVFIVVFSIIIFVAKAVERISSGLMEGAAKLPLNRAIGVAFSTAKFVFIVSCYIVFVDKIDEKFVLFDKEDTEETFLYPNFKRIAPAIFPELNFDNIKNSDYIETVQNYVLNIDGALIPVNKGMERLKGKSGRVSWISYKDEDYEDNHKLIIVEATVENSDETQIKKAVFKFLLHKKKKKVALKYFNLNGTNYKNAVAYEALKSGKFKD